MSVSHRHLAVWSGNHLILIDVLTGETLAILGGTHSAGWIQPTFHWNGTQLACTVAENYAQILVIYDLKTGKETLRVPIPGDIWERPGNSESTFGGFTWIDDKTGIVGGRLMIDLETGLPIYKFQAKPAWTKAGPLVWHEKSLQGQFLNAVKIAPINKPDSDATNDIYLVQPGSTISVESNHAAPAEVASKCDAAMNNCVKRLNLKVAEGQRITLQVDTKIEKTGKTIVVTQSRFSGLRIQRLPRKDDEEVPEHKVTVRVSWNVDGKERWSRETPIQLSSTASWRDDPEKTTEQEIIDLQWSQAAAYISNAFLSVPGYVIDPAKFSSIPSGPYPTPGSR